MNDVRNGVNAVIIMVKEIIMLRNYVKRNYVNGQLYVLHTYSDTSGQAVLSSIVVQTLL